MLSFLATALGMSRRSIRAPTKLVLRGGEEAHLQGQGEAEKLRLVSARGELLFEYHPATRATRLCFPEGDLKLEAPQGRIELEAAKGVGVRTDRDIALEGDGGVRLEAKSQSSMTLRPHALDLEAPRLSMAGKRGELRLENLSYAGRRLRACLVEAEVAVGILQTAAETVRQRAKNLYRSVEGLVQTRSGRLRTLVSGSAHFSGRDLYLRAERDTKIDGSQIHLG